MMEALVCHPLGISPCHFLSFRLQKLTGISDTIKVRMQLSRRARAPGAKKRGFIGTGAEIIKKETPLGLYKGLGAVLTGIVPKMAIRFTSFEAYKKLLANKETGQVSGQSTFLGSFFPLLGSLAVEPLPPEILFSIQHR
jgi:solute carrier family 25 citrate transporter 1